MSTETKKVVVADNKARFRIKNETEEIPILIEHVQDENGNPLEIILTVNKDIAYAKIGDREANAVKVDIENSDVSFSANKFIEGIWSDLVVKTQPEGINPDEMALWGVATVNLIYNHLYKYYKKNLPGQKSIETTKKK